MVVRILLEAIARAFSAIGASGRGDAAAPDTTAAPTASTPPAPEGAATLQLRAALAGNPSFAVQCRWVTGEIAIGGLIGTVENMHRLRAAGVTHVLNLQAEFDDRAILGDTGIDVTWIPQPNGTRISAEAVRAAVTASGPVLRRPGTRMFVHCLAGQHRAPVFGYALLRTFGVPAEDARARIVAIEPRAHLDSDELDVVETIVREREYASLYGC